MAHRLVAVHPALLAKAGGCGAHALLRCLQNTAVVVDQLSKEMALVLAMADIREKLATRRSVAKSSTPDEFDRFVRVETDKVNKVIKDGGIKLE